MRSETSSPDALLWSPDDGNKSREESVLFETDEVSFLPPRAASTENNAERASNADVSEPPAPLDLEVCVCIANYENNNHVVDSTFFSIEQNYVDGVV